MATSAIAEVPVEDGRGERAATNQVRPPPDAQVAHGVASALTELGS
jgi:hypothetical protein